MERFDPNEFSLVIVDEAHHASAASYRAVMAHYQQNPNVRVLGLTATPDRADERALGQVFDEVPFEYDINDGIDGGWLVPITQQAVHIESLDYSAIRPPPATSTGRIWPRSWSSSRICTAWQHPSWICAATARL